MLREQQPGLELGSVRASERWEAGTRGRGLEGFPGASDGIAGVGMIVERPVRVTDRACDCPAQAAVLLVQLALPHLRKRPGASIVFVSSVTAFK